MDDRAAFLAGLEGFEWDAANTAKNVLGHGVSPAEAEEIFFRFPLLVAADVKHSHEEARWLALGATSAGRGLAVAFTVRGKRIRCISVRDMSRKERRTYAEAH